MRSLGFDWAGGLGFAARVGLLSWFVRLVVTLAVALLLGAALRAVMLSYRRRSLEQAHWTERARVYLPRRQALFFLYLSLAMSGSFWISFGYEPVTAFSLRVSFVLIFVAFVVPLWRLRTGFEVAVGALRRPASSLREVLGVSLVFYPALCWLPLVLFLQIPTTAWSFWIAVGTSAAYLLITGFGGAAVLARALGFLMPARESVVAAVSRAATAMNRPVPPTYELVWSRANAAALRGYAGERAVGERLREQGRIQDALAFWTGNGESSDPKRLSQILWLQLEGGDCSSARRTVERMRASNRRENALKLTQRSCADR